MQATDVLWITTRSLAVIETPVPPVRETRVGLFFHKIQHEGVFHAVLPLENGTYNAELPRSSFTNGSKSMLYCLMCAAVRAANVWFLADPSAVKGPC